MEQLPDYTAIAEELAFAGKLARAYDQRLTFHPPHFIKLGAEDGPLVDRSLKELEVHSQVDLSPQTFTHKIAMLTHPCICKSSKVCMRLHALVS